MQPRKQEEAALRLEGEGRARSRGEPPSDADAGVRQRAILQRGGKPIDDAYPSRPQAAQPLPAAVTRDGILIFHSIHRVMQAEKVLKAAGLAVRLMPVPRQLSSDCGLAIAFGFAELDAVRRVLVGAGCPWEELHRRQGESYTEVEE